MLPFPENEILRGCLRGESKSQEALYKRFASKMLGLCCRYASSREQAEDLLQEGFIKVFRSLKDFRSEGSLEGWIRRIMVTTALEQVRREVRFFAVTQLENARHTASDEATLSGMNTAEIIAEIQKLPTGYRTVLSLYAIDGYSHKEIGDMLGISEGTSKSQLSRAREILKESLGEYNQNKSGNAG